VPVPWRLVRTPRVSRHLAAALKVHYLRGHPFLSDPPQQTLNPFQPLYATPACRSKVLHGVQRAGSRVGRLRERAKKYTNYAATHIHFLSDPPQQTLNPFQPLSATPACRSKVLHGVQRAGSRVGRLRGREDATKGTVGIVQRRL
jgi:hypothetical protein